MESEEKVLIQYRGTMVGGMEKTYLGIFSPYSLISILKL